MKTLIILLTLIFISCKDYQSHCDLTLLEKDGFMLHGGFFDKYNNGKIFISIVRVNDPKNWDYNEYFTGTDFSENESDEMKVLREDSCDLKDLYFNYLKK